MKQPKQKKCKNCKQPFTPIRSTLEKYCKESECVRVWVAIEKEKAWKKTKAVKKAELMTVQDYIKIAQVTFNKYIRLRDKDNVCISCQKPAKKENCGHYFNANNHWNVRFDEDNCHLQCEHCNTFLSGNLLEYQGHLINKLGIEKYEALVERARKTRKFTIEELKEIIETYKQKIKELCK
jgi:hypothetical protein